MGGKVAMGLRNKLIVHCDRCGVEREFDLYIDMYKNEWGHVICVINKRVEDRYLCPHCHSLYMNGYITQREVEEGFEKTNCR